MASSINGGNFSNFNKVGNFQPKTTPSGPKESPSVQQDPSETVQLGAQPVADAKTDVVSTGTQTFDLATPSVKSYVQTSIPSQVDGLNIAGFSGVKRPSFDGLSLNSIGSMSLQGLNGSTLASVSPLNQVSATRPPTTSADAVVSTFEDVVWTTTSGRTISL